jgi:hypothetical protein
MQTYTSLHPSCTVLLIITSCLFAPLFHAWQAAAADGEELEEDGEGEQRMGASLDDQTMAAEEEEWEVSAMDLIGRRQVKI